MQQLLDPVLQLRKNPVAQFLFAIYILLKKTAKSTCVKYIKAS